MFKRLLSIVIAVGFVWGAVGCTSENVGSGEKPKSLMEEVTTEEIVDEPDSVYDENLKDTMGDFAFELLKNCDEGEGNIMISPASVAFALGMTANGSADETREAMEKILGKELNLDLINKMYRYYAALLTADEETKIEIAKSSWSKSRKDLQVNNDVFGKMLNLL